MDPCQHLPDICRAPALFRQRRTLIWINKNAHSSLGGGGISSQKRGGLPVSDPGPARAGQSPGGPSAEGSGSGGGGSAGRDGAASLTCGSLGLRKRPEWEPAGAASRVTGAVRVCAPRRAPSCFDPPRAEDESGSPASGRGPCMPPAGSPVRPAGRRAPAGPEPLAGVSRGNAAGRCAGGPRRDPASSPEARDPRGSSPRARGCRRARSPRNASGPARH